MTENKNVKDGERRKEKRLPVFHFCFSGLKRRKVKKNHLVSENDLNKLCGSEWLRYLSWALAEDSKAV